ncbi:MAG: hypothetical protein M1269_06265 [Chloroflexi bacterium]|nr:hypothetical protein [Chloroflexota bacterium]
MRLSFIVAILLIVIFSVFQTSTAYSRLPGGLCPDFVGMLVLSCGALWGSRKGGMAGFIAGLLVGLPLLHFWGFRVFLYCGMGMLAGLVSKRFYMENPLALGLLGLGGGVLLGFLPPFFAYIFNEAVYPEFVFYDFTFSLGAGLLFIFIFYYLLSFIQGREEGGFKVSRP